MTTPDDTRPLPSTGLDFDAIDARWSLARMAGEAADDGGEGWDPSKIAAMVRSWQDVRDLRSACLDLIDALRLTQEYVGLDTLPPVEGWSWWDALVAYAPDVAEQITRTQGRHRRPV